MELALLRLVLGRVILLLGLLLLLVVDRLLLKALVVTEVVMRRGTGPRLPRLLRCLSMDFDRAHGLTRRRHLLLALGEVCQLVHLLVEGDEVGDDRCALVQYLIQLAILRRRCGLLLLKKILDIW